MMRNRYLCPRVHSNEILKILIRIIFKLQIFNVNLVDEIACFGILYAYTLLKLSWYSMYIINQEFSGT